MTLRTKSTGLRQKKCREVGAVNRVTDQGSGSCGVSTGKPLCCAWHGKCHMSQYTCIHQHELAIVQRFQCALDLQSFSSIVGTLGCVDVSDHPNCSVMPGLYSGGDPSATL